MKIWYGTSLTPTWSTTLLLLFFPNIMGSKSVSMIGKIVYAVNAGGPTHIDSYGIEYQADSLSTGIISDYGKRYWSIGRVDPQDSILYQTERYSEETFGYNIPLKDDGDYVLVLKFCEVYFLNPGKKVKKLKIQSIDRQSVSISIC